MEDTDAKCVLFSSERHTQCVGFLDHNMRCRLIEFSDLRRIDSYQGKNQSLRAIAPAKACKRSPLVKRVPAEQDLLELLGFEGADAHYDVLVSREFHVSLSSQETR